MGKPHPIELHEGVVAFVNEGAKVWSQSKETKASPKSRRKVGAQVKRFAGEDLYYLNISHAVLFVSIRRRPHRL
ncbi:hypothetical protein NCHU2750_01900 [Neorhizobium sp. NCHU2750]|nr:hypothetical protein NCHU2750_01900 [Neorhizobium sp. NCHU2750]